jgi:isocitrate dehydrogenase (NAD+)
MKITLIPGDGIGPEVCESAARCIDAASRKTIEWERFIAGEVSLKKYGNTLPAETLKSIRKNKIALKGPITTPVGEGFRSVNVGLRKELELFANIRPARIFKGVKTRFDNVDLVVIRENLEDLYSGIEFEKGKFKNVGKDAAVSLKVISVKNSKNIIDFAFQYAVKNKRKKVTLVHKANILKLTDGLFLEIGRRIAKKYPQIEFEDRIVDNMCMQLVQKPELYDVLVCPNLYGDIISDLCSGLVGGLGVAPSANIGKKYAVFEAVHGSAPKYAGQNKANPTAMILAGVLMLRHIGMTKEADKLERAVAEVIAEGKYVTYDLAKDEGKAVGTKEMADAVISRL